jgi:hypothetical protein
MGGDRPLIKYMLRLVLPGFSQSLLFVLTAPMPRHVAVRNRYRNSGMFTNGLVVNRWGKVRRKYH